jgi:hypothetical protein
MVFRSSRAARTRIAVDCLFLEVSASTKFFRKGGETLQHILKSLPP